MSTNPPFILVLNPSVFPNLVSELTAANGDTPPVNLSSTEETSAPETPPVVSVSHQVIVPLVLRTKYYDADTQLCLYDGSTSTVEEDSKIWTDSVEAVVLCCTSADVTIMLDSWTSLIGALDPAIRILLVDRVDEVKRNSIVEAAVDERFELIELDPSEETRAQLTEYREQIGTSALLQVLKSHQWPNATLKTNPDEAHIKRLMDMLDKRTEKATSEKAANSPADQLNAIEDDVSADPESAETFESMFAKFAAMKAHAETLPIGSDERREYAAKVAMDYWRLIGGDDSSDDEVGDNGPDPPLSANSKS